MHTLAVLLTFLAAIAFTFCTMAIIVANPQGDLLLSGVLISMAAFSGGMAAIFLDEQR